MIRNAFLILIVVFVETFLVQGQSTLELCEANGMNCAAEIQNQLHVCTQIEDLLGRHLNSITQNLKVIHQNVQKGVEFNEGLQLKFQNLSNLYEEQVNVQRSVGRLLEEHRQGIRGLEMWPRDCADIRKVGQNVSEVYQVSILGPGLIPNEFLVYCDMNSSDASWLVFQRRKDGSKNFERTWLEYKNGFGNLRGEFWLGNNALHLLTSNRKYKLRIELEDFEGNKRYAEYTEFAVGSASDKYRLNFSLYSGNAGDSMVDHNGRIFSTIDADPNKCAQTFRGAWWYDNCHKANLNGLYLRGNHSSYGDGVEWFTFRGHQYSLKMTEMKIAPMN